LSHNEAAAIEFLQKTRLSDILFYRAPVGIKTVQVSEKYGDSFRMRDVDISELNILQLATIKGLENLVKYILNDHRYLSTASRQLKAVDSRVILAPLHYF